MFCLHYEQVDTRKRVVSSCEYPTGEKDERCRAEKVNKRKVLLLAVQSCARMQPY